MKLFSRVLIFFYLLSTHLSLTHTHDDHHEHIDCKVCHVSQTIDSADIDIEIPQNVVVKTNLLFTLYHDSCKCTKILKGYYSHAPPPYFL